MRTQLSPQHKATPLAQHLCDGKVYRHEDLAPYSASVDHELQQLVASGRLVKAARGLYYSPRKSVFGDIPPAEDDMLEAFLKDKNFFVLIPASITRYAWA